MRFGTELDSVLVSGIEPADLQTVDLAGYTSEIQRAMTVRVAMVLMEWLMEQLVEQLEKQME